jgi:hypothetical protein
MTVLRCTSLERNLLDLAADFASPQVFNVIRTAYDSKQNKKEINNRKIVESQA